MTSIQFTDEIVRQYLERMGIEPTGSIIRSYNPEEYKKNYSSLRKYVEESLDKYKGELQRVLWPIFVHAYLELVSKEHIIQATEFFDTFQSDHSTHIKELKSLRVITHAHHIQENELAQNFLSKKFPVQMTNTAYDIFIDFLQDKSFLLRIVNQHLKIEVGTSHTEIGIPGFSSQELEEFNQQEVQLGHMPMDPAMRDEIERVLSDEDNYRIAQIEAEYQAGTDEQKTNGIAYQSHSLQQEFIEKVKREQSSDAPDRASIPLPSYKGSDIRAQVELIKDISQRIELGPSTTLPSVCFYTFHNTHNSLNCISISEDSSLIAGGFSDSYIKLWCLKGEKLKGFQNHVNISEINSASDLENKREHLGSDFKKLLGHSGPIFGLSFSPDNKYLVSCSEDRTVRLWSTDTYTNVVCYKGHNSPVWDVDFSPHGFYFATAGHDRTARLWSCDHIYPLRIFAGHLSDVDCVKFHPNSKYVITGSVDKSVRMWDVQRGSCFRIFSGHVGGIYCMSVSPDGRILASGGEDKTIMLWDLGSGKLLKKMTGHADVIYSLDFSKEGTILASGSADNTVRLWDVKKGISDDSYDVDNLSTNKVRSQDNETKPYSYMKSSAPTIIPTKDLITTLSTKKTPVYKIYFTRRNLCLAAGAYCVTEEEKIKAL
ncbi:6516_t:CDS:10 [Cetraspora pellucida]|uniref:6516_t:CDS:1 n=1 Tax=Cetraspora pellucida TaxID=1433469 RepID=A0A9N9EMW0_9GLOM|nr:6516_t:CDS:10 [Cetraspora pellucida]